MITKFKCKGNHNWQIHQLLSVFFAFFHIKMCLLSRNLHQMAQKTASATIPPQQFRHRHLRMPQSYAPQGRPLACADTPDFALSPTSRHTYITASSVWSAKRLAIILYISIHAPTWGATHRRHDTHHEARVSIHAPTWGATQEVFIIKSLRQTAGETPTLPVVAHSDIACAFILRNTAFLKVMIWIPSYWDYHRLH